MRDVQVLGTDERTADRFDPHLFFNSCTGSVVQVEDQYHGITGSESMVGLYGNTDTIPGYILNHHIVAHA